MENNQNYQRLVELVTREVMKSLANGGTEPISTEKPTVLVLGDSVLLPDYLRAQFRVATAEDYSKNPSLSDIERVYITKLSITELADIALGRADGVTQCAVSNALLHAKEIVLLAEALPHRRYLGKCNPAYFQMLEQYVQTLERFGVRVQPLNTFAKDVVTKPQEMVAPVIIHSEEKVITELAARKLVAKGASEIHLPTGTVITPSAKDIFEQSGKLIVKG